ncbi:MAG: phage tail sheath C-terminal domain-containing protein [Agriterribacter sp.]
MATPHESRYIIPGVYIEEKILLPPSVTQVNSCVPVFIGYTQMSDESAVRFKPVKISTLFEYISIFGGEEEKEITVTLSDTDTPVLLQMSMPEITHHLYYQLEMFYANGGRDCYIISVGDYSMMPVCGDAAKPEGLLGGLSIAAVQTGITLLVIPEAVLLNEPDYTTVVRNMLEQCGILKDRFAIIDVYNGATYSQQIIDDHRSAVGDSYLKYAASYFPYLNTSLLRGFKDALINIEQPGGELHNKKLSEEIATTNGCFFIKDKYPALYNDILTEWNKHTITLSPSATIAGVYSSVDNQRGVWKAPANISLSNVLSPAAVIDDEIQSGLNVDVTEGKSINAIRSFYGKGVLVWGARTLDGNNNEWRYISVRRFFIMLEESVKLSLAPFAFEPNDGNTWVKVRAMIENFMTNLWRQGALQGAKPEEAFFVKAGLGDTMTIDDILNGRMIVEIGVAPVRPAEFIVISIAQIMCKDC